MSRAPKIIATTLGAIALAGGAAFGGYLWRNITYFSRDMAKVWQAGYGTHQASINGATINYAEGPDNGPPLLLIPGQLMDWQNYARVLPALAERFHVFAVDVHGHGESSHDPAKYANATVGADLANFIDTVIGQPAFVAGHSSGGLVTTWLAAHRSQLLRGALLEDPPFFTTNLPRAQQTYNWVDLATACHEFLAARQRDPEVRDFVAHYLANAKFWEFFDDGARRFRDEALAEHRRNPDEPVLLRLLPPVVNETHRALDRYDPQFGDTFYTGSWNHGWDEHGALANVGVPAVYIHTKVMHDDNGLLLGATSNEEADVAASMIPGVEFHRVDSGHNFHFEKPREYVQILTDLADRLPTGPTA